MTCLFEVNSLSSSSFWKICQGKFKHHCKYANVCKTRNEIILGCLVISHNLEAFDLVLRLGSDYRDMADEKTDKQIQNEIRSRDYKVEK